MANAMKPNAIATFNYIKEHDGEKITAMDIAEATGLETKSVNGIVTSFQKKELVVRTPGEIENPDGTHKAVKFISLTDAGKEFEPTPVEED